MKRDTSTKAAPSSFWLYFALITILIVGVAGVTYKVRAQSDTDKRDLHTG